MSKRKDDEVVMTTKPAFVPKQHQQRNSIANHLALIETSNISEKFSPLYRQVRKYVSSLATVRGNQ
jgi:hypothetical protein